MQVSGPEVLHFSFLLSAHPGLQGDIFWGDPHPHPSNFLLQTWQYHPAANNMDFEALRDMDSCLAFPSFWLSDHDKLCNLQSINFLIGEMELLPTLWIFVRFK